MSFYKILALSLLPALAFGQAGLEEDAPALCYTTENYAASYDIYSWNARNSIISDKLAEGEFHGQVEAPEGSVLTSIKLSPESSEELPIFINENYNRSMLEHLFIVIHGKRRDGDHYWKIMNDAIMDAKDEGFYKSERQVAVISPQFYSTVYNSGAYSEKQLAWGDLNAWQSGGTATHPTETTTSSFDALDYLISGFTDSLQYPKLTNITVVGHGGGGQLAQRYAAVGKDFSEHVHIRYIHGDPSSCAYFTTDRPILTDTGGVQAVCQYNNTWRYGFDKFDGEHPEKTPQEYFKQYITRDVVSLVGYEDTSSTGDESCMARAQGGRRRRDRNLTWYRYINMLAGTDEDLTGFPGEFQDITDWSQIANNRSSLRLVIVKDAEHNMKELLRNENARSALFEDKDVKIGWRPTRSPDMTE
ncbi:hypothetical protein B0I35DRAFT_476481 [Stachybotrys elegans]|uniref:Alpha/beta hydrolase n=1 Tax=Stachybotrys elegans TaxID=80388 RepID=A0A8K0SR89_9HYPO|nr:hypothetical protein B0I35DRAFT_476481 [Stachybotrys elegans]